MRGKGGISHPPTQPHDRGVVLTAFPCLQLPDWLTHTSASKVGSIVLPRWGAGHALSSIAADGGLAGTAVLLWPQGQVSHLPQVLMGRGGRVSPPSILIRQMNNGDSSLMLTVLGLVQPHLSQQGWLYCAALEKCRACSPECCSLWGARIYF